MRTAHVLKTKLGATVRVFSDDCVVDERQFVSKDEAEVFLCRAGWVTADQLVWQEAEPRCIYPVMVPPPLCDVVSNGSRELAVGSVRLRVATYSCGYGGWAFCYRSPQSGSEDPVLGFMCPAGVKAGGIGVWPMREMASDFGVQMLASWERVYGTEFLECAIIGQLCRARLREAPVAGRRLVGA